jgi:hypothetical protein
MFYLCRMRKPAGKGSSLVPEDSAGKIGVCVPRHNGFYHRSNFFFLVVDATDGKDLPFRDSELDTSKSQNVFGYRYKTLLESAKDMTADFKARGW